MEARAAREYWRRLFPRFTRSDSQDLRNSLLDYGYAVVRGCVARSCVAAGLLPCFGVHHHSAANAFNLADDLIEPFRPIVDSRVFDLTEGGSRRDGSVALPDRQSLAGLPLSEVRMGAERMTLLAAAEALAISFIRCLETSQAAVLVLPSGHGQL